MVQLLLLFFASNDVGLVDLAPNATKCFGWFFYITVSRVGCFCLRRISLEFCTYHFNLNVNFKKQGIKCLIAFSTRSDGISSCSFIRLRLCAYVCTFTFVRLQHKYIITHSTFWVWVSRQVYCVAIPKILFYDALPYYLVCYSWPSCVLREPTIMNSKEFKYTCLWYMTAINSNSKNNRFDDINRKLHKRKKLLIYSIPLI